MIDKLTSKLKSLFFTKEAKKIFGHKACGEPCYVCGNPMQTEQGITLVGGGEKMHSACYGDFFNTRMSELTNRHDK